MVLFKNPGQSSRQDAQKAHTLPEPLAAKEFSGKFVLRLEPALHRRLAAKALAAGESLNSYCAKTLVKA